MSLVPPLRLRCRDPSCLLVGLLALSGLSALAFSFLGTPRVVARYLSPDGVLAVRTMRQIQWLRVSAAVFGIANLGVLAWLTRRRERLEAVVSWGRRAIEHRPAWLPHMVLGTVLTFFTFIHVSEVLGGWRDVRGAEYYDIARSIAAGEGFSVNESDRWFWYDFERDESEYDVDSYHATAIEEPVYPMVLGHALLWLGEPAKAVVLMVQVLAWALTCLLTFALASQAFGRPVGLLAGVAMAFWPDATYLTVGYLGSGPFGALLVALITYLTLRSIESRGLLRDLAFGALLGTATLTLAAMQVLVPLVAAATVWLRGWKDRKSWVHAAAMIGMAAIVVAPWTIRNWQVFGQPVPVRNGAGLIAHQGNPILAASFHPNPQACSDDIEPYWTAAGPREAVLGLKHDQRKEMAIYKHSYDCIALQAPEGYVDFNEAQRDKLYLAKAMEFIKSRPLLFAEMSAYKYLSLLIGWRPLHSFVAALALIGGLAALRRKEGVVIVLTLAAFIAPYALGVPWGYRYRYPLEPLLLTLAAFCCVGALRMLWAPHEPLARDEKTSSRRKLGVTSSWS